MLFLLCFLNATSANAEGTEHDHSRTDSRTQGAKGLLPSVVRRISSDVKHEGIDGMLGVEVIFDVEADPADVLDILWNVKRFQETFPDVQSIEVLERRENELITHVKVDAGLATVEYTTRRSFDASAGRVSWVELGGDLERVRGSWTVTSLAGGKRCHVRYRSFVVVSAWVPESVYRELVFQKVDEMIGRVRRAADRTQSGATRSNRAKSVEEKP